MKHIHRQEALGVNVVVAMRKAREVVIPTTKHPRLRDAVPVWIEAQAASGDIRASTAGMYKGRLRHWAFPHPLKGGGTLGDLSIDRLRGNSWVRSS